MAMRREIRPQKLCKLSTSVFQNIFLQTPENVNITWALKVLAAWTKMSLGLEIVVNCSKLNEPLTIAMYIENWVLLIF